MKRLFLITGFILFASVVFSKEDSLQLSLYDGDRLPADVYSSMRLPVRHSFLSGKQASTPTIDMAGRRRPSAVRFVAPTLLIACGVAARFNDTPVRRFDKYVAERVDMNIDRRYAVDDYLAAAPAVFAHGLDFFPGVTARHDFGDRTLILATSYLFMWGTVTVMKQQIPVVRPRGWNDDAFPSGHTAIAFTGAHILYREYKDLSPWIGVGGYVVATAAGAFRVVNRAHWVSDIAAGAGIGILSAEIGYMMLPVWRRLFGLGDSRERWVVVPSVGVRSVGVGFTCVF
jgi:membrane-associated phospholipid phosphatase